MRLVRGKIVAKPCSPKATGFQIDLYKTEGVPEEHAHDLETRFMKPLDNDASTALHMMLQGREPQEQRYRQAWATFLLSLLYRHKECVEMLKGHMTELWSTSIASLEPMWAEHRTAGKATTLAEAARLSIGDRAGIDASNMLAEIINHDRAVPDIMNMLWTLIDVSEASRTLLTSDRPIIMPMGLANPQAYIGLPISPERLFIAAYNDRFRHQPKVSRSEIIRIANRDVVRQAREYVWATDDSQKEFVQKHIGTMPDRVIMTEEQRDQSLRVARGEPAASVVPD